MVTCLQLEAFFLASMVIALIISVQGLGSAGLDFVVDLVTLTTKWSKALTVVAHAFLLLSLGTNFWALFLLALKIWYAQFIFA
jgi:hypothetical protein